MKFNKLVTALIWIFATILATLSFLLAGNKVFMAILCLIWSQALVKEIGSRRESVKIRDRLYNEIMKRKADERG